MKNISRIKDFGIASFGFIVIKVVIFVIFFIEATNIYPQAGGIQLYSMNMGEIPTKPD